MIEEARDNLEYQKIKRYEPHLAVLRSWWRVRLALKRIIAGYGLPYECIQVNHVRKIQQIKSYDNTMHGVYAGTVEFGKIPKAQLDWTSKVDWPCSFIFIQINWKKNIMSDFNFNEVVIDRVHRIHEYDLNGKRLWTMNQVKDRSWLWRRDRLRSGCTGR